MNSTITEPKYDEFVNVVVRRGLGIYGRDRMVQICDKSGLILDENDNITWTNEDKAKITEQLILNYSEFNVVAKMTAMTLALKYGIPIPEQFKKKKRVSRFRRIFKFRK